MAVQSAVTRQDDVFEQLSQTQFDAVQFLNDTLPSLALTSQGASTKQTRTTLLQSNSADLQTYLSKLNTHSIRSSSELTSLNDEILRSGNRLAYEVEVLRGDVNNLYELLTDSLKDDISRFVSGEVVQEQISTDDLTGTNGISRDAEDEKSTSPNDPDFIRQLRVLGNVKLRLEAVIQAFGEALKWPIPASEVSMATSLISVSAPELGVVSPPEDEKAREYARKLRNEIAEALDSEGGGTAGVELATKKINNLRAISQVWKGTAEEKARTKMVDNLSKVVEDKRRLLDARSAPARQNTDGPVARSSSIPGRAGRIVEGSTNTAAGLFRNLQKLRDEIYLD